MRVTLDFKFSWLDPARWLYCGLGMAAGLALADGTGAKGRTEVSYYRDVRPLFQARCHGCHQPAKAKGGYVMTDFATLLKGGDSGDRAVIPRNPDQSHLVELITPVNGKVEMPRKGDPLSRSEIDLIRHWIAQGAGDDTPVNAKEQFSMDHPPVYALPPVITALDFSPDGALLAVAGFHEVLLHRADGSGLVARLVGLSERIESIAFSPDGKRLAVTGGLPARMGEVQVWNVEKRKLELSLPVTFDTVHGASWSPDGKLIAFGCADTTLRAIDSKTGEQVLYQGTHSDWVLDTVFSLKGDYVISVGRDRATKLTELATQRFIDNITSITPGALKGGINAVARHPQRDEILVGGADGTPQIYRVFRRTKRVIGDNANLVRRFPSMTGRIFSVDYSPDGKRIVAGSSLDGVGYVNLYSSDFDGGLTDELKRIMEKVASSRSAEEKAKLEAYRKKDIALLAAASFPGGVYAVAFASDGRTIAAGGSGGVVRLLDADSGALISAFLSVPLKTVKPDEVFSLSVEPQRIDLLGKFDYGQLVVRGWTASGEARDLTRDVGYGFDHDLIEISKTGRVRGVGDGQGQLTVTYGNLSSSIPCNISRMKAPVRPDFIRDVGPLVSKMGCNAGTCHGSKKGKDGFKLSLRGYDPIYDVRAFTDDLAARRVNFAFPDDSLMLLKATAAVPHEGGQRTKPGEDAYAILRAWIAQGCKLNVKSPRVTAIRLTPRNPVVQAIGAKEQMRVVAVYANGSERDVTGEAFIESGNIEILKAESNGLIKSLRRGEAPVLARFEGAYDATTLTVMGDRDGFKWAEPEKFNHIDELVAAKWKRMKILGSKLCTDAEFIRRVYLDVTGLPPASDVVRAFLAEKQDPRAKRAALVDRLVGSDAYVDYWSNKWADLLQVNRKFLGVEGAKLFRDWIHREVKRNIPYDQFVRSVLMATGSTKDHPAASYYKILRDPEHIMENTTQLFLATRFNCNKCHDHPFERWTQDQYYQLSAYFARVSFKKDPSSGDKRIAGTAVEGSKPLYEVVFDKKQGEETNQRTGQLAPPKFPYQTRYQVDQDATRRDELAAWLTSPDNRYFAKSYVNRIWGYLMGVGLIEPLDDIRAGNPPSNPELLEWLTKDFMASGFNVQHLVKIICQSRTYQLSVETNQWNDDDGINYSHALPKRLPAEVLYDAIYFTTGSVPTFPGVPRGTLAVQLPDVGVKLPDGFLATLGRPARESACECERSNDLKLGSVMSLISGPTVDQAISDPENAIAKLVKAQSDDRKVIEELYMRILNRPATSKEVETVLKTFGVIAPQHRQLVANLKHYEAQMAPIMRQRETERENAIDLAKRTLAAYEAEIAPREAELDRKQQERIAGLETRIQHHLGRLDSALARWEGQPDRATRWVVLDPKQLKASNGATLVLQRDLSVLASGKNGKTTYEVLAESSLKGINGLRLEVLGDDRLPKTGPGRADDGNFVLTEMEVFWAPKSEPGNRKKLKLEKARADFSQKQFGVAAAIDGDVFNGGRGWAISPERGQSHLATFEFQNPVAGREEGVLLTVKLHQYYRSKKHSIGRFRLAVSHSRKPLDFGVPDGIREILKVTRAERSEEQRKALLAFYRGFDPELKTLKNRLAEAKKPRAADPRREQLQAELKAASEPVAVDPTLKELRRSVALSTKQMKHVRVTAAQDVAWALVNNPAFLFNR